ncbi:MAG: hypothetical protein AAF787_12085, partial [Chloroflexota bacterium]
FAHCGTLVDDGNQLVDFYIEPPQADDIEMRFGESVALVPFFDFDRNIPDVALISSGWIVGDDVPPYTYSVALYVVDTDGNIVTQADYPLPQAGAHCGYGTLDLSGLAGGRYEVLVGVYAWESGERLPGTMENSNATSERLSLGVIIREN